MPSGFQIITSNRMECLAAHLADVLRFSMDDPGCHPLRPQTVMVQSKGMQRWISMTIARLNGVCANIDFPFPNAFLEHLYEQVVGPLPEQHPYEPHALAFRINDMLPDLIDRPAFVPLRRYLSDQYQRPLKIYQLSRKIADVFDQYAVYRPDLLSAWERGRCAPEGNPNAAWQAELWRMLVKHTRVPHRTSLQKMLVRRLADLDTPVPLQRLPSGLSVFGISHLPPFHLEVLEALAHRIPVHLFLLNPCREYWFDILSDHQMIRARGKRNLPESIDHLHFERGNRLLASLGHLGRPFFERLYQLPGDQDELFVDNCLQSLLGRIQQDVLDLVDRPNHDEPASVTADGTLRIHVCHSPMREVEVLYDQCLDILERHPDLQPRDILVMTPDIAVYSPYIHAVFGAQDGSRVQLPFSVADQGMAQESKLVETFGHLLDLVDRRFEASRVLTLLDCSAVCRQFGLSDADRPVLENWIRKAGIRWGWDAAARKREKLPGFKENSWRNGLDRLVLGYAMASDDTRLFAGLLPCEGIGTGEGRILGALVAFAEAVNECLGRLAVSDTLEGWHRRLCDTLERLFRADEQSETDMQVLRGVIDQLQQVGWEKAQQRTVAFEVIRRYVKDALGRLSHPAGFLSGGITFCAMLPMRSVPAEVICLLGMNHDAYPREQHEPGFNLIAEEPRSGDRSKRFDDRYLFLETLVSARKVLYISYVGKNIQDNSPIPPSALVDELTEYVEEGFGVPARAFTVEHPLQGFSPSYFNGTNPLLFSYSAENRSASAESPLKTPPVLFDQPLEPPPERYKTCEWEQLAAFFAHPARFLMEQRLGVDLHMEEQTIEDRESFILDGLAQYRIRGRMLTAFLKGESTEGVFRALQASGILPHGMAGRVLFDQLDREVRSFMSMLASLLPEGAPSVEQVEWDAGTCSVSGRIDGLYDHARIAFRLAGTRPSDVLKTFLFHLALLASSKKGLPDTSILICKDAVWRFGPLDHPDAVLAMYLNLFDRGMRFPLPLFNRTSFEFAHQHLVMQRPRKTALAFAAKKWRGNDFAPGECDDPYHKRCFGDRDPLTDAFEAVALEVYTPLFGAGTKTGTDAFV